MLTDNELAGDLPVRRSAGNEGQYLALPFCQPMVCPAIGAGHAGEFEQIGHCAKPSEYRTSRVKMHLGGLAITSIRADPAEKNTYAGRFIRHFHLLPSRPGLSELGHRFVGVTLRKGNRAGGLSRRRQQELRPAFLCQENQFVGG